MSRYLTEPHVTQTHGYRQSSNHLGQAADIQHRRWLFRRLEQNVLERAMRTIPTFELMRKLDCCRV